jgi:hypothetical protein
VFSIDAFQKTIMSLIHGHVLVVLLMFCKRQQQVRLIIVFWCFFVVALQKMMTSLVHGHLLSFFVDALQKTTSQAHHHLLV